MNYLSITDYLTTVALHEEPKHFPQYCFLQTETISMKQQHFKKKTEKTTPKSLFKIIKIFCYIITMFLMFGFKKKISIFEMQWYF